MDDPTSGSPRAQSELLGLLLVLSLVILGASAVVILGAAAMDDSTSSISTQRAEKVLTLFDSKAAMVALGSTDVQSVHLPTDAGRFAGREETGFLNVTILNTTSGNKEPLVNQSLGAVTYDGDGTTLAYQGGGVWRADANRSTMVSPPEFHFRNGTLVLPVVTVDTDAELTRRVALANNSTTSMYPVYANDNKTNPLDEHRVSVVVRSRFYRAWGAYFEERTDGLVSYDHDENKATIDLVSPLGTTRIKAASASRAASGTFSVNGAAASDCAPDDVYTNSYNSSGNSDPYCAQTPGDNGHVVYGQDVDLSDGSGGDDVRGNLVSGGTVDLTDSNGAGQPEVFGHINYTDTCSSCASQIRNSPPHDVREINGIATMNAVNMLLETTVDDIESDNRNGPAADVDTPSDTVDFSGGTATLTAGRYYLKNLHVNDGDRLVLDTSGGDVTIAVDGGIKLHGSGGGLGDGGTIDVQGDGVGKIYVRGKDAVHGRAYDVVVEENAGFVTGGVSGQENATQVRLYGRDDLKVSLQGNGNNFAKYVGVIFSPPGNSGTARIDIDGGEIFGGVLTGTTTIEKGSIHYDEALRNTQVISRDEHVIKVTYLHVTVNRVRVTG